MKIGLLLLGILLMILGGVFTLTIIGALIGIPVSIAGFIIFILGIILPIRL